MLQRHIKKDECVPELLSRMFVSAGDLELTGILGDVSKKTLWGYPCHRQTPVASRFTAGRSSDFPRNSFRLPIPADPRLVPIGSSGQWRFRNDSLLSQTLGRAGITAAGPLRYRTGFPIVSKVENQHGEKIRYFSANETAHEDRSMKSGQNNNIPAFAGMVDVMTAKAGVECCSGLSFE